MRSSAWEALPACLVPTSVTISASFPSEADLVTLGSGVQIGQQLGDDGQDGRVGSRRSHRTVKSFDTAKTVHGA